MQIAFHITTLAAIALVSVAAPGQGAAQQFSADIVRTPGRTADVTRIYVGSTKLRFETLENGQPAGGVIWDFTTQAMTFVLDKQQAYIGGSNNALVTRMMTQSGAPSLWRLFRPMSSSDPCTSWNALVKSYARYDTTRTRQLTCTSLGSEAVNGRAASKWAVTSTGGGRTETGTVWIDSRLRVVSKSQDSTGTMQMVNVQEGPQPASVFAIPATYRPLDIRQMMAGMKLGAGADSLAAALGNAAKDVGNNAANSTASAAKAQATTNVTKKLKGILRLP